ncbi:MAG: cohesin domain-containing protein [Acidobacteriaceae bacterium]
MRWTGIGRKAWIALALGCAIAIGAAAADSASSLYNKGRVAEIQNDPIGAYENYKRAYELKPADLKYRIAYDRSRLYAAAEHVKRGEKLKQEGKLEEALAEFQAGLTADPEYMAAGQEVEATQELKQRKAGTLPKAQKKEESTDHTLKQMALNAPGPIELAPLNNELLDLSTTDDSKKIYQTIAQLAGINVIFDPDYVGRRIPVQLDHVTLSEALTVVATLSQTFWTPVTSNTILVAANTTNRRQDLETQVYKTIYFGNVTGGTTGQNELGELVTAIRAIVGQRIKIQAIQSQNAIAIRGTADEVALAEKIAGDFDKARPEVVVDVMVMQVRREKIRDLGLLLPPANATTSNPLAISLTPPNGTTTTTNNGGTTSGTGTNGTGTVNNGSGQQTTTSNGLTLNTFNNLHANNFAVNIPPATLNAMLNDANTRVLENPRIRAESGAKASIKIGSRYPIAQGSYQPGLAGVGGLGGLNSLIGTNFQYIDVGVNIDITPTVYTNSDVGLKLTLDISSVSSNVNIGGITQPIISQRKVDNEIRIKDGEVNMLGGIIEQQDIKSWQGIPGFSSIPFFRYLFGSDHTDKVDDEVVFVLVPHIIRAQYLTDENRRAIDIGTNNGIDLRRRSANPGGAAGTTVPAPPVTDVRPAGQPQPTTTAPANTQQTSQETSGTEMRLVVDPVQATHQVGETFAVNINVDNAKDLASVPLQITYDPKQIAVVNISNGGFLSKDGQPAALVNRKDEATGQLVISASRPPDAPGVSGKGTIYTLTLQAKAPGTSVIAITKPGARNAQQGVIPVLGSQAEITVK